MKCISVAALLLISPASAVAAPSWVPVAIDPAGAVIVPVVINNNGPFPFLLDTGASHSVISESLADRLKLQRVAKVRVMTSTGGATRPVARLDQTSIGSARSDNVLPSIASAAQLASIKPGIEGIIGQDFLFALNYTLDYRRRRLIWSDAAGEEGGTRLPLVWRDGRYLVEIAAAGNDSAMMLVPDSGANGFVMFARKGRTPAALDRATQTMSVHSMSGTHAARMMLRRELRIGDVTVRDQPVAVIAREEGDERDGHGLLPLHVFASVSFNARDQCLIVRRD